MQRYRSQWIWISLGVAALLLRMLGGARPQWVETYYSRGLFRGVRWCIDYLLAWIPFPLIYLFFAGLLFFTGRAVYRWGKRRQPLRQRLTGAGMGVLAFLGGGLFFFLFLWGFNYARPSIESQLSLEVQPLSKEELREELVLETEAIIALRPLVPGAGDQAIGASNLPAGLERELREDLKAWLQEQNFPTPGRVRARLLYPRGIFLRFSSAGLYWPFTGEGHADAGLHPLQLPSVIAHEMGHGYGFADEGTCSFLAYVSTFYSKDPFIAYAGRLDHWRTLAGQYRRLDPEGFEGLYASLPPGIQADLQAIYDTMQKYPDLMPKLRYSFYDSYLKSQGIEEGMQNYNRVVMLVRAWRKQES